MPDNRIRPITMPKWGLSMSEGKVNGWLEPLGSKVKVGDELLEIETDKITNVVEAGDSGILRRVLGEAGKVYPVKALLGVLADEDVPDAEIDAYVASYITPGSDEGEEQESPKDEFVDLPLGTIRYTRRGEGPSLVMIHGFGGDFDTWLFNIDALAENATVYALDLPGHGRSVKALADPTIGGMANAVIAFMDALGIDAAHLVGHSLGGAIAIRTALAAPQRVRSLALIGSAGLGAEINRDYILGFISASSRRAMKPVLAQLFSNADLVSSKMVEDILKYKRIDGVADALGALAVTLVDGRELETLLATAQGALEMPVLVVWGTDDRIIPVAHASALGETARVEVINEAGHMVQMEAANRVNALLKEHLLSVA